MSDGALTRRKLSAYEADQVEDIALWKSEPPNPLSEIWTMMVVPVAALIEKVVPNFLVQFAIERAYDVSALLANRNDILKQAGINELSELHNRPLDECDRLAKRVGLIAESVATLEGAATGFGGIWTTALDVPLVFGLALRTIIKVGHCYGYELDQEKDRPFVLGVLLVASSGSLGTRRERLSQLRELEDFLLAETQIDLLGQEILSFLFQLEIFEDVPGIGAITGGLINLAFLQSVELTARRVFQERWLLDTGRIHHEIVPAAAPARQLASGWSGALGRAIYGGTYYTAFVTAMPFWSARALFRPASRQLMRGLRERASHAAASYHPRGRRGHSIAPAPA